jgi:hypothetical protein
MHCSATRKSKRKETKERDFKLASLFAYYHRTTTTYTHGFAKIPTAVISTKKAKPQKPSEAETRA